MKRIHALSISVLLALTSCSSATSTNTSGDVSAGLRFDSVANFGSFTDIALSAPVAKTTAGVCASLEEPVLMDDPDLADGLDCDGDGGVVAHITPTKYSLALKRVTMLSDNDAAIDLISDTGTLAASQVIDFVSDDPSETIITIEPDNLTAGTYTGLEFEIYYFQLTFDVGGTEKNVRFYMSDDDFGSEGNLGHHQGDITFVDDDGMELGWINGTWSETSENRNVQEGAGGTDPETGHARGFFGNSDQWNDTAQMQGAGQDVFNYKIQLSSPLSIAEAIASDYLTKVTATFSVADAFFYEDFENPTLVRCTGFCPEEGGDAGLENAEWAPLAPTATLTVDKEFGINPLSYTDFYGIWGPDSQYSSVIYLVGKTSSTNGVIYQYDGIGLTNVTPYSVAPLMSVWGNNTGEHVWFGGSGLHYHGPWAYPDWAPVFGAGVYNDIWGSSENNIYAAGENMWIHNIVRGSSQSYASTYKYSVDYSLYYHDPELEGVWGSSQNDIFIVGEAGDSHYVEEDIWGYVNEPPVILHWNGSSWTQMVNDANEDLNGIWGVSGSNVYAVGEGGTILHYDGISWSQMTSGTTGDLRDIWGVSATNIFAVGGARVCSTGPTATCWVEGIILHYDGISWSKMNIGSTPYLMDVWGRSSTDVYAVGFNGAFLHYDGKTWSSL